MRISQLKVTNFRGFDEADFDFQPGMNLIVGINGAGKSSILDVLRIMISQVLPRVSQVSMKPMSFSPDDISKDHPSLTAQLKFEVINDDDAYHDYHHDYDYAEFTYLVHKQSESSKPTKLQGNVRKQTFDLPDLSILKPDDKEILLKSKKNEFKKSLVVYYSTLRSHPNMGKATKQNDALLHRELRLGEFAEWWLAQDALAKESYSSAVEHAKKLKYIGESVEKFLDGCTNLRAVDEPEKTLVVDKDGVTLDVRHLSDGERGFLALIFDLSRRLYESIESLYYSVRLGEEEGEDLAQRIDTVVLIDEIDLHLHPRWQRDIVHKLTKTFPNCQFIATTHSPQVVGEVPPENIIILEKGKTPYKPDQSLGMDTNWILEFLMDTHSRNPEFEQKLTHISDLIEDNEFETAQREIDELKDSNLARDPELVRLQARLSRYQILKDDQKKN